MFSSLSESGFIPTTRKGFYTCYCNVGSHLFQRVASFLQHYFHKAFRRFPYCSHLFQRVASFLPGNTEKIEFILYRSSHLFQRVASFLQGRSDLVAPNTGRLVLISFREWLHSYLEGAYLACKTAQDCSHLFQRVASFLQMIPSPFCGNLVSKVLISFREWLHSYPSGW